MLFPAHFQIFREEVMNKDTSHSYLPSCESGILTNFQFADLPTFA